MRKLGICFTAAFVTFSIGLLIAALFVFPAPNESDLLARKAHVDLVGSMPEELLLSPEPDASKGSDLSIVIKTWDPNPNAPSHYYRHLKLSELGRAIFDLDLGEDIDNQEVVLNFRDKSSEYRIFQRYRTSMTINVEGPHLDLIDWRHFDSPWISLQSLGGQRFHMLAADQIEDSRFPPTTNSEIMKEAKRHVGNDWPALLELVEDCSGPDEGACIVSVSSIYLRIQKRMKTGWLDVGFVEVRIPMGC